MAEPASTDARLSALSLSAGTLDPVFASDTTGYTATVPNATGSIKVVPMASDANATITVNGTPVASGSASGAIALDVGPNTVTVVVTAEDGSTETYTVTVTREAAIALILNPADGTALPEAMAGEDYSFSIRATGGKGAVLYEVVGGTLPGEMILNISTGELTGPSKTDADGTYSFTVQAKDASGNTDSATYTLIVVERAITADNHEVTVSEGSTPPNVDLTRGATGGPFLDAVVVSVEPANAGTAEIVGTQYAQAGGATPLQFYLKFTPNPSFTGQARVQYQLISSLGTSNVGAVVYNLSYDPVAVVDEIDRLARGFVQTRQNLIASTIKMPGLLERRRLEAARDPITARMSPSMDGLTLGFATSLAQMNAASNAIDGMADAGAGPSAFNVWIDGTVMFHNREQNGNRWGSFGMLSTGADYLLTDTALIGLSLHYDRMTDPTDADATLTGNGWLVGPYASFELGNGVFWDTSLLYGGSWNTIDTAFWDGTFDTRRWLFDTSISGQWQLDTLTTLTPKLRAVYLNETVHNYSVENGNSALAIEGFTSEQLRVSMGAEIARQYILESGAVLTPSFGLAGGFSGLDGSGAFGSVSAGVSYQSPNTWTVDGGCFSELKAMAKHLWVPRSAWA